MEFEWDADKATSNLTKHGVAFAEAMTVFADQLEMMIPDPVHSEAEMRFVSVGLSEAGRLIGRQLHGTRSADSNHQRAEGNSQGAQSI